MYAYISGYRRPALFDQRSQSTVLEEKSSIRFSQQVVAKAEFYRSGKAKMDLERDEKIDPAMKNTHFSVWLARAKAFVRIPCILRQFSKESDGDSCNFS